VRMLRIRTPPRVEGIPFGFLCQDLSTRSRHVAALSGRHS
jgi:hypothetical protein